MDIQPQKVQLYFLEKCQKFRKSLGSQILFDFGLILWVKEIITLLFGEKPTFDKGLPKKNQVLEDGSQRGRPNAENLQLWWNYMAYCHSLVRISPHRFRQA